MLNILLNESYYDEVLILVRKELPVSHKKLVQLVIDFDKLDDHAAAITGHAVFCCLGSTVKKTPDLAVYRKIDHDYPLILAQLARQNDVEQYHLVSSIGANSQSSNFYTKMKGEVEEAIEKVGLNCLHIYQPSVLTGGRKESRPMERFIIGLMKVVDPLLVGGLKKYRSISAGTVARAMFNESIKKQEGVFVHASDKIKLLA
ncbi:MAG TPA: nucleoside-diphosphate sugar epimerase [Mucilaginibacter sp.]